MNKGTFCAHHHYHHQLKGELIITLPWGAQEEWKNFNI